MLEAGNQASGCPHISAASDRGSGEKQNICSADTAKFANTAVADRILIQQPVSKERISEETDRGRPDESNVVGHEEAEELTASLACQARR